MTIAAEIDDRISKCQKILDLDPNSQIFAALAEAYRKKGELDKAFRICQNGLKIHPSYGSAHIVMAKVNLDRGLYDWAEAEVEKTIEIDGRSRAVELLLAEIYIYKGEFNAAIKLLKELHRADPDNSQIRKLLDIAVRLPEEQRALSEQRAQVQSADEEETADDAAGDAPTGQIERKAVASLTEAEIVQYAIRIPEVTGALFINFEGLVIESEWALDVDAEKCAARMAATYTDLDQELAKYSFGNTSTVLIETPDRVFYMVKVTSGIFIFAGTMKVNLGTLRMKLAELFDRYQA
jgi:predicted regulator of Ras-like GTPase activity (Roadblock/LC7/MglB family)